MGQNFDDTFWPVPNILMASVFANVVIYFPFFLFSDNVWKKWKDVCIFTPRALFEGG